MTEWPPGSRASPRVHPSYTPCAPPTRCVLALCATLLPGVAVAGPGWDAFVARCLDPFEHQTLPIVDDLAEQPADQMHDAIRVYAADAFTLLLDAAPATGDRACAVEVPAAAVDAMAEDWASAQVASGRYVREADWLVSNEWIEPRVMVRIDGGAFRVVETDLES